MKIPFVRQSIVLNLWKETENYEPFRAIMGQYAKEKHLAERIIMVEKKPFSIKHFKALISYGFCSRWILCVNCLYFKMSKEKKKKKKQLYVWLNNTIKLDARSVQHNNRIVVFSL